MRSFASLKEGNVKASKNERAKGERKGKRPEGLNGTRGGREGEHIQVFSPIMACILFPRAVCINIPSLEPCENIGSFFLEQTASKEEKFFEKCASSSHSLPFSWLVESHCGASRVERRRRSRGPRSQTLPRRAKATDISDTELGSSLRPHFHTYSPALSLQSTEIG